MLVQLGHRHSCWTTPVSGKALAAVLLEITGGSLHATFNRNGGEPFSSTPMFSNSESQLISPGDDWAAQSVSIFASGGR